MWVEKWTIMQEASGSSTAPNAASCLAWNIPVASISVQAKLDVVRRKHIVHPAGFGAYSSTFCKGIDNCVGTMGVDQLPSSTVRL